MDDASRKLTIEAAHDLVSRALERIQRLARRLEAHLALDGSTACRRTARGRATSDDLHAEIDSLAASLTADVLDPARRLLESTHRDTGDARRDPRAKGG